MSDQQQAECTRCGIYTCPSERTESPDGMLCKSCAERVARSVPVQKESAQDAAASASASSWQTGSSFGEEAKTVAEEEPP